jgi:CubicO group peptidase (beta-lactamase class C family)
MTLPTHSPTMSRRGLLCVGALLAARPAFAQEAPGAVRAETGYPSLSGRGGPPATLLERMALWRVPGVSIAVFDRTGLLWAKGYGLADQASGRPVMADTLFQAASKSKPVTAVPPPPGGGPVWDPTICPPPYIPTPDRGGAAWGWAPTGQLPLDEDINLHLRGWKVPDSRFTRGEKVTVRRILSHTAGLSVSGLPGYQAGSALPTLAQILKGERPASNDAVRSILTPGERFEYSGGGYTALQLLMEEKSGEPFETLVRRLVFEPAGMASSSFDPAVPPALRSRAALAYDSFGQPVPGGWRLFPTQAPAGLWTTPVDLVRFILAMQGAFDGTPSPLSTVAMAREMIAPQPGNPAWGLGFQFGQSPGGPTVGHSGSNTGFKCRWLTFRNSGQGVVVMTNGENGGMVMNDIMPVLAASQGWFMPPPINPHVYALEPQAARRFEGVYRDRRRFTADIAEDGGQLLFRPRGQAPFLLFAVGPSHFLSPSNQVIAEFSLEANEVNTVTMRQNDEVVFEGRKEAVAA